MLTLVIIACTILMILGLIGCIVPTVPGPPLSFAALLILAVFRGFIAPLTFKFIMLMGMLTVVVTALDYVIPAAGAKKYGASKWGIWGSILGMIFGILYFPPLGMIIGAFFGAVGIELLLGKSSKEAIKAGWGALVGTLLGTVLKFLASGIMTYYFIKALI